MSRERLEGTTLRVYKELVLAGRPMGVRELQRKLGLSSPSLALYHLSKLERMGLVERLEGGKYSVRKVVKVGVLKHFIVLRRLAVPRMVFHSVLVTSLAVAYALSLNPGSLGTDEALGLVAAFAGALALWYETIKLLRS